MFPTSCFNEKWGLDPLVIDMVMCARITFNGLERIDDPYKSEEYKSMTVTIYTHTSTNKGSRL